MAAVSGSYRVNGMRWPSKLPGGTRDAAKPSKFHRFDREQPPRNLPQGTNLTSGGWLPWRRSRCIARRGQDHLYEFGTSTDSMGRTRELRRGQGRRCDVDAQPCARGGRRAHSHQCDCVGCYSYAYQQGVLGDRGRTVAAHVPYTLRSSWRTRRRRARSRLACQRCCRLRGRNDLDCRRRHDTVSMLRC